MARGTGNTVLGRLLKRVEKISPGDLATSTKRNTPTEVTELVATILAAGIRANATAIHIEPRTDGVHIRHRIDGVLNEAELLPRAVGPVLVAGLKILVHLPAIEDEVIPQQASMTVVVQSKPYRLRLVTVPVEDGEKAVVQLNSISAKAPTLSELGYWGPNLAALTEALAAHKGLILLAGPHDAGQAEGMFSMLSHISSPNTSIATIEDPILYRLPGATQVQVNERAGLSFVTGLRAMVRQDANILMVSSLRDADTTRLAADSALSGRLLLAGLHADRAADALGYLLASGVEPYAAAHTVRVIVGQRVVRRLCENCKELYSPAEPEMISLLKSLGIKTAAQLARVRELEQQAIAEKLVVGASPADDAAFITHLYRASKSGCAQCGHTGYKGSMGIHEAMPISETLQRLIVGAATIRAIEDQAISDGMPTMQMDGLVKTLLGLTSVDEVLSATRQ